MPSNVEGPVGPMAHRADEVIRSRKNDWVQSIVRLAKTRERYQQNVFLVEGEHAVQEMLASKWPVDCFIATPQWWSSRSGDSRSTPCLIERQASESSIRVQLVDDDIMARIATTDTPDGVMAVAKMPTSSERNIARDPRDTGLLIAAQRLQDPGNLGTLIRSALACDAEPLFLSEGSVDRFHPKVIRSTAGQWFHAPPRVGNLKEWIASQQSSGVQVYAAAAGGESYWNCDFRNPTAFVLGNEGAGLTEDILHSADQIVSVPMRNDVESLNVGMTGTLLLYEAMRQRSQGNT